MSGQGEPVVRIKLASWRWCFDPPGRSGAAPRRIDRQVLACAIALADKTPTTSRHRSTRYRGALDLEPEWTQEVMVDEHLVELSPYPASRVGASGFIGYSPAAGRVLVVIAYRDVDGELHGMNAWPASGRDLAT